MIGETRVQENKNIINYYGCDILCATPGRLQHLIEDNAVRFFSLNSPTD